MRFSSIVSFILGFAPSSSRPFVSSSNQYGIILPNPFDQLCGVFMLEGKVIDQWLLSELGLPNITLWVFVDV
jgi:hypothetical protein